MPCTCFAHYSDVLMRVMASQIADVSIVCSAVLFGRRSKKTSKLCVTGLCEGNSPVTGEFPAQRASNAKNVSVWWRQHVPRIRNIFHTQHPNIPRNCNVVCHPISTPVWSNDGWLIYYPLIDNTWINVLSCIYIYIKRCDHWMNFIFKYKSLSHYI